eukprot:CAMPEP_0197075694 /NCGR_PEP_ID=MMETSP1384-20130603/211739_1 /TAXON_ID=29189 /ORGANISM="Ammonia sp." /LENGTH=498 /DNA_ID=CAMNT_0042514543 /DNA_START=436 /DNA_END=1932 /DNA_ORIENTATION=-
MAKTVSERVSILSANDINQSSEPPLIQKISSPKTILFAYQAALLTATQTFFSLFEKCFPAFIAFVVTDYSFSYSFVTISLAIGSLTTMICIVIAFVVTDYSFSYSFVTISLAIGSLTTMICIVITPYLLHLKSNVVQFLMCILCCVGTAILWQFRHAQHILFTVGIALVLNTYQLQWGAMNAMISSFVSKNDKAIAHRYLSAVSSGWTIATFLFVGVGYILKYETFWAYLEWMFLIFVVLACLNLLLLPKVSVNQYNVLHHSRYEMDKRISMKQDLKVLFSIKEYRLILVILSTGFFCWSWIYTSFGFWIQRLYALDQAELGIAAALIEGVGNAVAILCITYLAKTHDDEEDDDESEQEERPRNGYKMKLEVMMAYFAVMIFVSVLALLLASYVEQLTFLLQYKAFVYTCICAYYCGNEVVIVGALILNVTETPPKQQARSSAIVSIANSICMFIGQATVGIVYEIGSFPLETPFILALSAVLIASTVHLSFVMKQKQ